MRSPFKLRIFITYLYETVSNLEKTFVKRAAFYFDFLNL